MSDDTDISLPATVDGLIELLNKQFPERSADLSMTDRQIWFDGGSRAVVRFVNALRDRRDENVLN